MAARDLTRADARREIEETRRRLGVLNHLAIAGLLDSNPDDLFTAMSDLVAFHQVALNLIDLLGKSALQLPEEAP